MIRTLSTALTILLGSALAVAQQSAPSQPDNTQPQQQGRSFHHPNPHREAAMLSRRLNLTPDQTTKLEPILADRDGKLSTLHSDASLAPEAKRAQIKSIRLDTEQQLSNVLTPEQMQKLQAMRHHHRGHEQAPATPSGL